MKRINNRGVVLLETLIVSVFVMTIFIFVYRNIVPMLGNYEKLETFDDVDSVYAANLVKNMVITNISSQYIDNNLLNTANYADISDCNDRNLYVDAGYCNKLKQNLHIEDTDIIYITKYSAKALDTFREDVNKNSKFSGGELGKFQDYLKSVANNESFYNPGAENNKVAGLYRVFISRSVPMLDGSTIKKFANIGIYKNNYTNSTITIFGREYAVIQNAPILTTASSNSNDESGLYKSTATNSGEATYYFRGNVTNNYVNFAGFTWRIVRVNEDGTIRLILNEGINSNTKYKYYSDYGNYTYSYYLNSTAKTEVDNWYNTNIAPKAVSSKIASGDYFCGQAKVVLSSGATGNITLPVYTSYASNFTCNNDGNGYGIINGNVGLLTVDELIHAGDYPKMNNSTDYLYDGNEKFWTMSPAGYSGATRTWFGNYPLNSMAGEWYIVSFNSYLLRPVINLKSSVTATGTGTLSDPFVIQ